MEDVEQLVKESPGFTAEEKSKIKVTGYGHVGDGNVHLNVAIPGYKDVELQDKLS